MSDNQKSTSTTPKQAPITNQPAQNIISITRVRILAFGSAGDQRQVCKGSPLVPKPKDGTTQLASEDAVKKASGVPQSEASKIPAGGSPMSTVGRPRPPSLVSNPAVSQAAARFKAARQERVRRLQKSGTYAAHLDDQQRAGVNRLLRRVHGSYRSSGPQDGRTPFQEDLSRKGLGNP